MGVKRSSGTCCSTREAGKSWPEKPLLNRLTKVPSISYGAIPASAIAAPATRPIRDSTSGSSSFPNGEWAQPTMHASVMMTLLVPVRRIVADCEAGREGRRIGRHRRASRGHPIYIRTWGIRIWGIRLHDVMKRNALYPSWPGVSRPPTRRRLYHVRGGPAGRGQVAGTRPGHDSDWEGSISDDRLWACPSG